MKESRRDDERSSESEDVGMEDLGDAKVETKQYVPVNFVNDSMWQIGWF